MGFGTDGLSLSPSNAIFFPLKAGNYFTVTCTLGSIRCILFVSKGGLVPSLSVQGQGTAFQDV